MLGQDRSETQKIEFGLGLARCGLGFGLAGLVLCCETRFCTLVVIMTLKDAATFQVLFIVSLFCAWNITTVEINSGAHLLNVP